MAWTRVGESSYFPKLRLREEKTFLSIRMLKMLKKWRAEGNNFLFSKRPSTLTLANPFVCSLSTFLQKIMILFTCHNPSLADLKKLARLFTLVWTWKELLSEQGFVGYFFGFLRRQKLCSHSSLYFYWKEEYSILSKQCSRKCFPLLFTKLDTRKWVWLEF